MLHLSLELTKGFIDKFEYNVSNKYIYMDETLNEKVSENTGYINYIKIFGKDLENKLKLANGDVNNIKITYDKDKNSRQIQPSFDQKMYDVLHGLTILLHFTEQTLIRLENYEYNGQTKEWSAILVIEILDHFGLDNKDLDVKWYFYPPGFQSWWVLQYRRGFIPFITQVNGRCKISGRL